MKNALALLFCLCFVASANAVPMSALFGGGDLTIDDKRFCDWQLLFDDSSDADHFGLTRLVKEIQSNKNYELALKNPNYLFKRIA